MTLLIMHSKDCFWLLSTVSKTFYESVTTLKRCVSVTNNLWVCCQNSKKELRVEQKEHPFWVLQSVKYTHAKTYV